MSIAPIRPVIFISYAHADEPEKPADGDVQWLSFVRRFLQPLVKHGVVELWDDGEMAGGADWEPEIERKLRACDVFILLVSAHSLASDYIVDKEIALIRQRQARGEDVCFYPLLVTPTPDAGLDKVRDKNLRPRDGKPFSSFAYNDRLQHMTEAANEIAKIAQGIVQRRGAATSMRAATRPAYVHISGLPETPYERLVGRDDELRRLDDAWADPGTKILSLVAEGGAGKSSLVNEWLRRLQAHNYRDAEMVLGWSFYSQGTKERATSAEPFLAWALEKLGIALETTSATAKAEAIAEAMVRRRVLLVLDGVEPLQHGPGTQLGQLKDQGLRALLRRVAATAPGEHGALVVLTSRLAVADIARWRDGAAPVIDLGRLSDEAGAVLLRDNGVWGIDQELRTAADDFEGHPLGLGLLASFLTETQTGDVRRRGRVRAHLTDTDNPRHDHAKRVMESYEKEWLAGETVLLAVMHMVGLFNRPATHDCLDALRAEPAINGLTDRIVTLGDGQWRRAVARLREVRLLAPADPAALDALDAHPLVREWFGERLRQTNEAAWKAAHSRLYEHLRDTTREGKEPTLEDLGPLYQAIGHGCQAGRHQDALEEIYKERICKRRPSGQIEFYAGRRLGANGSNLEALSWFFDESYQTPVATLDHADRVWALANAGFALRGLGRISDALPALRASMRMVEVATDWRNAAIGAANLSEAELLVGNVQDAVATALRGVANADRGGDLWQMMTARANHANALHFAGQRAKAEALFADAERRQTEMNPEYPLLYSQRGYHYCDLWIAKREWQAALGRARKVLEWPQITLLDRGLVRLSLGRAQLAWALAKIGGSAAAQCARDDVRTAAARLNESIDVLRQSGNSHYIPAGLRARAALRRSLGDWTGAVSDLDEVEEIAEPGPMRLFLCDIALERARLAFGTADAFAPLHGFLDDAPPKPERPSEAERSRMHGEAAKQLAIAAKYIETCGYHRRDEELAELQAVLRGEVSFASLPPRV